MYGKNELKESIRITDYSVECPVYNCKESVERQKSTFRRIDKFKCPLHNIYISPSTFEYETEFDNLLWTDTSDRALFNQIKTVKRESRIARDNSEDSVSWNVFRHLEKNTLIESLLTKISGKSYKYAKIVMK